MLLYKMYFVKVFLVLATIRYSDATNSSAIASSATINQMSTTQYISPNSTTTTSIPSSSSISGGSSGNTTTAPPTPRSFFTFPSSFWQFTFPPQTTTPPPTTVPTAPDPCVFASKPTDIDKCGNESCALNVLSDLEMFINCGKSGSEVYYKHATSMAEMSEMLSLKISEDIKTKLEQHRPVNATVVIATDQLALGASTIESSMYTNISRGVFSFPNMSIEGTKEKLDTRARNSIRYPKKDLPMRSGLVRVAWSISEARDTKVPKDEIEPFQDIVWRLPVGDMKIEKNTILINKEKPDLAINSPVITFSMVPQPVTPLENSFQIEFRKLKSDGMRNPRCYFWSATSATSGFWSSIGSSVVLSNDTHTVCSYNHMSTFVVLSEVYVEADEQAKKVVRIVAIVMCVLAMVALIATIRMARKLDCLDNDRVNIHVHLCVVLLIGYFLFIIGAIKSDIGVLNDILGVGLHFCQLSPFVWLCLEAVYFIHTVYPIFNYENTNTRKLYVSLGWAVTAAFAGATAGYDFPHNGQPLSSEIVWIFIKKATCGYFFGPFLALFVINILIRLGLVIYVSVGIEHNDGNKAPMRIRVNLLTTLVLAAVVFLAWYFGVQAVNNTDTKGYHFGFIVLYCFQAFLVFVIYGWQNEEMWSLYNKRKEEERQVEERKITFTYVP